MILTGTYTATRYTGELVTGDWQQTSSTTFSFRGSVQPITGRELERLPENARQRGRLKLYTAPTVDLRPLWVDGVLGGQPPDTVLVEGRQLEVIARLDYSGHRVRTAHRKYILAEPDEADGL